MSLSSRISKFDTWAELERAAIARYWDGVSLATDRDGRHLGSVYFLGYVAEMLIKVAYYRVRSVASMANLRDELRGMPDRARSLGLIWSGRGHNLDCLAQLLIVERKVRGFPMDPGLSTVLEHHVDSIAQQWTEQLRYKDEIATQSENERMLDHVDWILSNYDYLWS